MSSSIGTRCSSQPAPPPQKKSRRELTACTARATHVPVGHDQAQHLEFARECATNFNHAYGPCLVQPETMIRTQLPRSAMQSPS